MKINENKDLTIPYSEVNFGECFKYNTDIYMKCKNNDNDMWDLKIFDVNLKTGDVLIPLSPNAQVTYLPNATVNINGD